MIVLEKIPVFILMIVSLFGFLFGEMIKCDYNRKTKKSNSGVYRYTAYVSIICCLLLWILSGFSINVSFYTVGVATVFGIAVMGQIVASASAIKRGPWSYTAVMMSLSTAIPALSGVIFWGEKLRFNKIIGILLMLVCFILSVKSDEDDAEKKQSNIKWLLLSIVASLCTGGIGILQKMHQSSPYKHELTMFLVISFAFSAVFSFIMMLVTDAKYGNKRSVNKRIIDKKIYLFFIVAGLGTAVNHTINLYLSGAMESSVFFPVMSGGELVFVTLSSVLIFHERLSVRQWIGLVCGILATVILCI